MCAVAPWCATMSLKGFRVTEILFIFIQNFIEKVVNFINGAMRKSHFQKGTASQKSLGTAGL